MDSMWRCFPGLAASLLLLCCGMEKKPPQNNPGNKDSAIQKPAVDGAKNLPETIHLTIGEMAALPEEIMGCSCYFSPSEEKFSEGKYLFASNFDSTAFMLINNSLLKLKLQNRVTEPLANGFENRVDTYRYGEYKVTVDIKFSRKNGDETWLNNGTILVERINGEKASIKFTGECGC